MLNQKEQQLNFRYLILIKIFKLINNNINNNHIEKYPCGNYTIKTNQGYYTHESKVIILKIYIYLFFL